MLDLPITSPALTFAVVMGLVLVVPLLAERVKIPGVVGVILAGALIGPYGLGLFERAGAFELLGGVGLLYLMFTAGLSIDLQQFARVRSQSLAFGAASFLLPQLAAVALAGPVLGYDLPTALLLGSIVGSHTLVAYPIVARLGLARTPAVTLTMGATMVTDVLSLVMLAVVEASVTGGGGTAFWVRFLVGVALFGVFVAVVLPRIGRWFFKTIDRGTDVALVFLLALVFLTAHLASVAKLAPIIGAFMAGLALNRLVPEPSALLTRVRAMGETLFIPFFLLSVGMLVDGRALVSSGRLWAMAAFFTALVLVGKTAAALGAARRFGQSRDAGWTMVGLTVPQAAATLAVTLIGFDLGLFDSDAVNAVVVMILVTCLIGAALAEHFGRRMADAEALAPSDEAAAPQRLLVPLANPQTAEALTALALLLRNPQADEPLNVLAVAAAGPGEAERVAAAERLVAVAHTHVAAADVPFQGLVRVDARIPAGIERAVREQRIAGVVIGWNGQAGREVGAIFGSVLDELLDQVAASVLVYRAASPLPTTRRIVHLAVDRADRAPGHAAVQTFVQRLSSRLGAPVVPVALPSRASDLLADVAIQPGDLIVLEASREGRVAWTPALRTLPRRLAAAYPDAPLVVAYPPEDPDALSEGLGLALRG